MQPFELIPDELRYFKTYQKGLRHHEEYVESCQVNTSLKSKNYDPAHLSSYLAAAEVDNRTSIECLSTYGLKFLDIYVEPLLQDTEESLNSYMGLTTQYEYRDICHTKEWDWQSYKKIKTSTSAMSVGFTKANNTDNTLTFDELHAFVKQMWSNYYELAELAGRLADRLACLEAWRDKQSDNP